MKRAVLTSSAFLVAALFSSADADDRVVVVRTGHEPACLDLAGVARAIARHAPVVSEVAAGGELDTFEVRITADGERVAIVVRGRGRDDRQVLAYGSCDALPDLIAAHVASAVIPEPDLGAPGSSRAITMPPLAPMITTERAVLLSDALRGYVPSDAKLARRAYVALTIIGATYGGLTIATSDSRAGTGLAIGGTSLILAGGLAAILRPDGDNADLIETTTYLVGFGTIVAGNAFIGTEVDASSLEVQRDRFHESDLISGGAFAATGLWYAIDRIRHPVTPPRTMWEIRRRLSTPERRARLSAEEVATYDEAYRHSVGPHRRYALPLAIGAAANFLLAGYDTNSKESDRALYNGALLAGVAAILLIVPDPIARYTRRVKETGIQLSVAPTDAGAAVALRGRF
jgi:hypothetical protein